MSAKDVAVEVMETISGSNLRRLIGLQELIRYPRDRAMLDEVFGLLMYLSDRARDYEDAKVRDYVASSEDEKEEGEKEEGEVEVSRRWVSDPDLYEDQ